MATNLIEWVHDDIREFRQVQELFKSSNPEFDFIYDVWLKWHENMRPQTSDKDGILRWEDLLDITPLPGETLEDRRFRVISRLNTRLPFTEIQLRKMLDGIVGWDNFELQVKDLELWLYLTLQTPTTMDTIVDMLISVVPENIIFHAIQRAKMQLNIRVGAMGRSKIKAKILPYQIRNMHFTNRSNIGSAHRSVHKVKILPFQNRKLEEVAIQPVAGGYIQKNHFSILPYQPRFLENTATEIVAASYIVREKIKIKPRGYKWQN